MNLPKEVFTHAPFWDEAGYSNAHHTPIPVSIRMNPRKPATLDFDSSIPWSENGRYLKERPVFTLDPLFHAGAYYVQEASSMMLEQAFLQYAPKQKPLKVLDLCAAPGGKSTLLASLIKEEDLLISNEVIQSRAGVLVENMTRWGQMNTWVSSNDPKDFGRLPGFFDFMVVDAPCSGSGLWRKDEKAIDEWSPAHVQMCSDRQKRILSDVLPALKKEGILVYATCSFSPEENEQMLDWLVEAHNLSSLPLQFDAEWGLTETISEKQKAYGYRAYPWKMKGEGFFIAILKKNDGLISEQIWAGSSRENAKEKQLQQIKTAFQPFLNCSFEMLSVQDMHYALHSEHMVHWAGIKSSLYIKKAGTALGQLLKGVVPEHDLAMSVHLSKEVPKVELSHQDALRYLKKESVAADLGLKGWHVASYQNLALGWGKWMPNRMNNYLPKHHRIRMDIE
jgi:16S rRNA C967 or C1407 C5-methylase (RsmB/RsmF family)/NOL1/NOP2/fmu family ribosome biogenesis protein